MERSNGDRQAPGGPNKDSGDLAQTLIAKDLVDEYHFWLYSVQVGT